jgi:hypothetical protein
MTTEQEGKTTGAPQVCSKGGAGMQQSGNTTEGQRRNQCTCNTGKQRSENPETLWCALGTPTNSLTLFNWCMRGVSVAIPPVNPQPEHHANQHGGLLQGLMGAHWLTANVRRNVAQRQHMRIFLLTKAHTRSRTNPPTTCGLPRRRLQLMSGAGNQAESGAVACPPRDFRR